LSHPWYSALLGAWFNIFPFKLSNLSGPLNAKTSLFNLEYLLPVPPFLVKYMPDGDKDIFDAAAAAMENEINGHNKAAGEYYSELALTSSSGLPNRGGITQDETSMEKVFEQFYRETLNAEIASRAVLGGLNADYSGSQGWLEMQKGVFSNHQYTDFNTLDLILNFRDRTLAESCLVEEASSANTNLRYTAGVMENLESLGHESEVLSEGLTCELLPFQKQSLKWALEREKVMDGIQSYSWVKVPVQVGEFKTEIYYSPILKEFRRNKPKVVRGGIIAEEMGLGKTIISLAMILKNPAPELPLSGSPTQSLSTCTSSPSQGDSCWNKEFQVTTPGRSPHRGSIMSRGTLVICPVSLVGQWIEEAKSKLKDPGLVYPYHGQNRNRDANILSKNAIVVTTYQVLASDDTHHRKRSDDPEYCPPLEQIRWWRIICDEGHCLRQANTNRNKSVTNLVADHKWLVSGTPVNTSIRDLKNQLSFIGIERVESLFKVFCGEHNSRNGDIESPGELIFFLRSIMMRHKQNQTYRGTKTTLMSLPAKTERTIEVSMSSDEKKEYDHLNNDAKSFYVNFKLAHWQDLSSHYLKLSQKLTPMRAACSGGFFPLNDVDTEDDQQDGDREEDEDQSPKKEVKYSSFAFTSKFKVLLSELERIRDEDPSSKSLVFSQYASTLNWLKEELPKHGFQFRTLTGDMSMKQRSKALHDFQADPPTTIFLLSIR
jgi:SNF2 family DNA or RNA helicase